MKPERIQILPETPVPSTGATAPTAPAVPAPTSPRSDRGVYQTFPFSSLRKADSFSAFVEEMADNYGLGVFCLTDSRTYEVELLLALSREAASEVAARLVTTAWQFLDKVESIFHTWRTPGKES